MKKKNIIIDFIIQNKLSYALGLCFMFSASYIASIFPKLLGSTIDILKTSNFNLEDVKRNILYIMLVAALSFGCTYIWRNLVMRNNRNLECLLREELFKHLQLLSPEFYNNRKTGDLIAYAINDIGAIRMSFGPAMAMSINGTVLCSTSIYSMIQAVNWKLTLISLLPIPVIVVFMIKIGAEIRRRFKRVQEGFGAISDRVQENIYGIRVIKAYVQEDYEVENFERLNKEMMDANLSMVKASSLLSPMIEICFSISFALNLIIGGNMVQNGTISVGDFIAFNTYLTMIMGPINSIGRVINIFQRGAASYKRLQEIFNAEPAVKDGQASVNTPIKGEIYIKNLEFSYPATEVKALENINLNIKKGSTLGIIGRTGSGKSTLANLLLKLYNVDSGKIVIDGIDINDYSLETLREGFGYVPQDNFLFSASIKDNITFFKDIFSDKDIEAAAKASCIYDSIMGFSNGFDTMLGERGVNLSGGQKQRVSMARAFIKNPPILILDDSLSAVDTITEAQILSNFAKVRKDKTAIIIAHKISSVKNADLIVVMDKGRICECGTHQQLLEERGLYYEIYEEQSKDQNNKFIFEASES
ncbi:ABC transporter ATP-binding protein [Clostridium thermarum]|uniref:ABC transporter ATP-binding protein n=1 Tax=Clostridium thermarum TaxID=1716543 RepID=UPI00111E7C62|nr:ABC transporter ATP-binding protein [Clostridium thermarum]